MEELKAGYITLFKILLNPAFICGMLLGLAYRTDNPLFGAAALIGLLILYFHEEAKRGESHDRL